MSASSYQVRLKGGKEAFTWREIKEGDDWKGVVDGRDGWEPTVKTRGVFPRSSQVDLHLQVHPPRLDAQDLLTSNHQQKILKRLDELFMFSGGILATMMQHALISQ